MVPHSSIFLAIPERGWEVLRKGKGSVDTDPEFAEAERTRTACYAMAPDTPALTHDRPHREAPPPTSAEMQRPTSWRATDQIAAPQDCIPQLVAAHAHATPEAVALVAGDGTPAMTYGSLNDAANRLAHHLRQLGVERGALVGVYLERSIDMVVGMLAILKAGAAYLPLDPSNPPTRLTFMLADARAPVLITRQCLAARLPRHPAQVVCLDADAPMLAHLPASEPVPTPTPDDLAYVIYTSGSTGQPKGVQITHGSLLNLVHWHQNAFAVTRADRATQLASPGFDAAGWELWPYLTAGASVSLPDEDTRVTPLLLRDWLVAQQISISFAPTPVAEHLLALEWPPETALRLLLTGGDTLHCFPPRGLPFALVNNYGPTETTVVATSGYVPPTAHAEALPTIGRPIANTQVLVLDERMQPVPVGVPGELYIGGRGIARGYLNRPDLTAERFVPHPFSNDPTARLYKTGDLVRYLPDGQLAFLGRADDQVKIRGYRIEPDEIAFALNRHPGVRASAVMAREDTPGDQRLVAYVVPVNETAAAASALRAFLATCLPDYMIPTAFVRLKELPLSLNGKVDRAALPAPDAVTEGRGVETASPLSPVEARLADFVATLLHLDQVGLDDNFFLLGGHSLLGTQLIARIADSLGVELTLRTLFEAPTVRQLAAEVEQRILATLQAMSVDEALPA